MTATTLDSMAQSTDNLEPEIPKWTTRPLSGFEAFRHARYQSEPSRHARSPESLVHAHEWTRECSSRSVIDLSVQMTTR